jgi:hypothetical protein
MICNDVIGFAIAQMVGPGCLAAAIRSVDFRACAAGRSPCVPKRLKPLKATFGRGRISARSMEAQQ